MILSRHMHLFLPRSSSISLSFLRIQQHVVYTYCTCFQFLTYPSAKQYIDQIVILLISCRHVVVCIIHHGFIKLHSVCALCLCVKAWFTHLHLPRFTVMRRNFTVRMNLVSSESLLPRDYWCIYSETINNSLCTLVSRSPSPSHSHTNLCW